VCYGDDANDVGLDCIDERELEPPKHFPPKNRRSAQRRTGFRVFEEEMNAYLNLSGEVAGHMRIHRSEPIEFGKKLVRCLGMELVSTS
jgi:hypothetical protein